MIGSGPAVSLGEELLYSDLTGSDDCEPSGLPPSEIEHRLDEAGPSGFDPRPYLESIVMPGLWMYCSDDLSVPVDRSTRVLEELQADLGTDWVIEIFPGCNHLFIVDGGPCQSSGQTYDWVSPAFDWLLARIAP